MATAFYIQPETFEFDPELNEYQSEWGELEGAFEQYEGAQPTTTTACPPYQRGEVERSRTQQGHLPSDVIEYPREGLVIADFGVDWRMPKAALARDPTLRKWLNTMIQVVRVNPRTKIWITGYSDCVGKEKNNDFLRRGRAQHVAQLLQQLAGPHWRYLRDKITPAPAPASSYLADNSTVQGRAQNRGVLIESKRIVSFPPEDVPVRFPAPTPDVEEPEYIQRVLTRARDLFGRTDKWDQFSMPITEERRQRVLCLLNQIAQPRSDVRYLTPLAVERYDRYPSIAEPEYMDAIKFLVPVKQPRGVDPRLATPGGRRTDKEIWRDMSLLEADIRAGIRMINQIFELRQSAVSQRVQRLRDWVAQQLNNPLSIYRCYR
jgi:outer membrane protein OmpA-like peptidoglycan-associated protein